MSVGKGRLIDGVGLWREMRGAPPAGAPRAALFLDRDGVVTVETGYLGRAGDVALAPGAAALVASCNRAGIPAIVVTNQSGVGRGFYDWDAFAEVQRAVASALAAAGAACDMVLACGYHECGQGRLRRAGHPWRKPAPGMLLEAARCRPVDLARSWIVGDRATDIAAGRAAGLAGGLHVAGTEDAAAAMRLRRRGFEVRRVDTLAGLRGVRDIIGDTGDAA